LQHLEKQNIYVHRFFIHSTSSINIVVGSSKGKDELQSTQVAEIESKFASLILEESKPNWYFAMS
jgi:hypothetical protein